MLYHRAHAPSIRLPGAATSCHHACIRRHACVSTLFRHTSYGAVHRCPAVNSYSVVILSIDGIYGRAVKELPPAGKNGETTPYTSPACRTSAKRNFLRSFTTACGRLPHTGVPRRARHHNLYLPPILLPRRITRACLPAFPSPTAAPACPPACACTSPTSEWLRRNGHLCLLPLKCVFCISLLLCLLYRTNIC